YRDLINNSHTIHYVTYAEIVLTAAEACIGLGEINQALVYLNQVRESQGKSPLSITGEAATRQALMDEIRNELGKDGLRFSALKRNGKAAVGLNMPVYRALLPLPQSDIDRNPAMTQNPGY